MVQLVMRLYAKQLLLHRARLLASLLTRAIHFHTCCSNQDLDPVSFVRHAVRPWWQRALGLPGQQVGPPAQHHRCIAGFVRTAESPLAAGCCCALLLAQRCSPLPTPRPPCTQVGLMAQGLQRGLDSAGRVRALAQPSSLLADALGPDTLVFLSGARPLFGRCSTCCCSCGDGAAATRPSMPCCSRSGQESIPPGGLRGRHIMPPLHQPPHLAPCSSPCQQMWRQRCGPTARWPTWLPAPTASW